jgi:hypothetical protein
MAALGRRGGVLRVPADRGKFLFSIVATGVFLPPVVALLVMYVRFGAEYRPTSMLIGIGVGSGLVFLLYSLLVRVELKSYPDGSSVQISALFRLVGAAVAMAVTAVVVSLGLEQSTHLNLEGSSTNPVAVFLLPFILLGIGLGAYYVGWIAGFLIERLRSTGQ